MKKLCILHYLSDLTNLLFMITIYYSNGQSGRVLVGFYHLLLNCRQFVVGILAFICGVGFEDVHVDLGLSRFYPPMNGNHAYNLWF